MSKEVDAYVVEAGEKLWGPFKTASAASEWAIKKLVDSCDWVVRPVARK